MRITRTKLLRFLVPGLLCVSLGLVGGCKNNSDSGSGGTTGGSGGTTATTDGASGTGGTKQDTSGDEILVGEYASLTGDTSTFGTQSHSGVQFAVDELNAKGGILGKKVRVDKQDDQSKPDEAKTVSIKFANDPKIVAVIGEVASKLSLNAAPELDKAGMPMITPSSTNPKVTQVGDIHLPRLLHRPVPGLRDGEVRAGEPEANKVAVSRTTRRLLHRARGRVPPGVREDGREDHRHGDVPRQGRHGLPRAADPSRGAAGGHLRAGLLRDVASSPGRRASRASTCR